MDFRAGSSPVARTKDKREAKASRLSLVKERSGLEPIAEELSGGQFLPPVQTLVATSIFCPGWGRKCKSSPVARTISSVHNGFDR